jgi:hypothetical protein
MLLFEDVGRALKDTPEQIVDTCVKVGVTGWLTVTVAMFEITDAQPPLVTTTL